MKTLSLRSNCWQTSREMERAQSRVLLQVLVKEAESRIMEGLRNFIKVDNHCALSGPLERRSKVF